MDPNAFSNKGFFDNWQEMFEAYYGVDPMSVFGNKTEAPYITTTQGIRNIIYGAWLTTVFVTSHNALGSMRDAPWRKSGYRVVTTPYFEAAGNSPGDGQTQGGAIPGSTQDVIDTLELNPKTLSNVLDISTAELAMEGRDDVAKWAELVDVRRKVLMTSWNRSFLAYAPQTNWASALNMTSLDCMIASYDQYANSGESPTSGGLTYAGKTRATEETEFDAYVQHFDGTPHTLALKHLDEMVVNCQPYWDDGSFENKHWITGVDTSARIQQLHMAMYRGKLEQSPVQYTVGGVKTLPGLGGLNFVNLYDNMAIVSDLFVDKHYTSSDTGLAKVYLVDDNYAEIAIGQPLEYQESKEYLATGYLAKRGIFHMVLEPAMWKFGGHGKTQCII